MGGRTRATRQPRVTIALAMACVCLAVVGCAVQPPPAGSTPSSGRKQSTPIDPTAPPAHPLPLEWAADVNGATGVAIAPDGRVYVSSYSDDTVTSFAADGGRLLTWGRTGGKRSEFRFPAGLAVGGDGNVYVADHDNRRIQRFTADGRFESSWPTSGTPVGVAVGDDGSVYVALDSEARVDAFDARGRFVRTVASRRDGIQHPAGIAVHRERMIVGDYATNNLHVVDLRSGTAVVIDVSDRLRAISAVAITGEGIAVADYGAAAIALFTSTGDFLAAWKSVATEPLRKPWGLAAAGNRIAMTSFSSGRVYLLELSG